MLFNFLWASFASCLDDQLENKLVYQEKKPLSLRHRQLLIPAISEYADPKKVSLKDDALVMLPDYIEPRPLQLLFLGGSNTYGARIENHMDAYPYQIGLPGYVDVAALNATGTWFYSLCLESIIERDFKGSTVPINMAPNEVDPNIIASEKNYDLIMLEFSVNGFENLEILVERLRRRYPKAVIVLFELWTLASMLTVSGETNKANLVAKTLRDAHPMHLEWNAKCDETGCGRVYAENIIEKHGGFSYKLPRNFVTPEDAVNSGWFTADWNHLTTRGHQAMALKLTNFFLKRERLMKQLYFPNKPIGSYGVGDQCYNWHHNGGKVPNELQHSGFELLHLDRNDASWKHVLSLVAPTGYITLQSQFQIPVPLAIVYVSQRDGTTFPMVEISINGKPSAVVNPNETNSRITSKMLRHSQIGFAAPGINMITFRLIQSTHSNDHFSVSAVLLCGTCVDHGNNLGEGEQAIHLLPQK